MSWHYLREVAGEFLEDICLGGEPLPPLKSKTTHAEFYCKGKLMDSYLDSLCGMTSAPLMDTLGEAKSMLSAGVSLVRTSPLQEKEMDSMVSGQDSGHTWRGWLARFDPLLCSWRTAQCSLLGEEHELLQTLPRWGMTQDGLLWEQPMWEHHTSETESGLWPTPVSSDISMRTTKYKQGGTALSLAVLTWPTPRTAGMCGGSGSWNLLNKNTTVEEARLMGAGNGGQLNPPWVEWLMGWPIGWTDLKPLGTDKSHYVQQQHGES
jgi:hypothetical protein